MSLEFLSSKSLENHKTVINFLGKELTSEG